MVVYEDPEATKIRSTVEQISGIDTNRSFVIAERYDTIQDIQDVDRSDLEAINDIGPQQAAAIKEAVE